MEQNKTHTRNFIPLILEGTFFLIGFAFLDSNSVIPIFIDTYTGSMQLAGLATSLGAAFSLLLQLLAGPYVDRIKNVPSFITRVMFLLRPLPLLMIPVLFSHLDPLITVIIFILIFSALWASDGAIVVAWMDLFGRTIPGNKRGKLLGYQQLLAGIGGLAAGFIIKTVLEHPGFSNEIRYSIIFGLSGLSLLISAIAMAFVRDIPREISKQKVNLIRYFSKLPGYFKKNNLYKEMVAVQIASNFVGTILPFVILFGKRVFQLNPTNISIFIYIQIIGTLAGGVFWGNMSHRFGNKYVILSSQIIGFILPFMGILSLFFTNILSPFLFLWPMALLTGINKGAWLGFANYNIDILDEAERPNYLVLNSVISFPLTFLSYFAGLAVELWGFTPLFVFTIFAAIFSILLSLRLKSPHEIESLKASSRTS